MVKKEDFYYDSTDKKTKIHAIKWIPMDKKIMGILQISHGMLEFIDRYDEFANYMAEEGFLVVGNDHLGHGNSVLTKEDMGFFSENDGVSAVLKDMHKLMNIAKEFHADIPYFLLGHSMGSFFTRKYITLYSDELQGAIIVGTGCQPYLLVKTGQVISKLIALFKGNRYRSKFVNNLALGSNNKMFKPARTANDWLSRDEKIVDAYNSDERTHCIFTLNSYYNMFSCMLYLYEDNNLKLMPKDLPVLIISGGNDPVGEFGKGVTKVYNKFIELGMKNVTFKLYKDSRHEIINEIDRNIVHKDILDWLNEREKSLLSKVNNCQ